MVCHLFVAKLSPDTMMDTLHLYLNPNTNAFDKNTKMFFQDNTFENVYHKISAILFRFISVDDINIIILAGQICELPLH